MDVIRPRDGEDVWVVQSVRGRDRKRVFLAFRCPSSADCTPVHGSFPAIYTVNGTLHRVECPKKKHLAHVKVIGTLSSTETEQLLSGYSNKTVAQIVAKYDVGGELLKKREKNEISY